LLIAQSKLRLDHKIEIKALDIMTQGDIVIMSLNRRCVVTDTKYNGWTNYATWRINLEMIDGIDPTEQFKGLTEPYDLALALKEHCIEILETDLLFKGKRASAEPLVMSYAMAFLSDVNWHEIAKNLLEAYEEA
jgi:hypothetical protein